MQFADDAAPDLLMEMPILADDAGMLESAGADSAAPGMLGRDDSMDDLAESGLPDIKL